MCAGLDTNGSEKLHFNADTLLQGELLHGCPFAHTVMLPHNSL